MESLLRLTVSVVAVVAVHVWSAPATADYVGLECEPFEDPQWSPNGYSGLQTIRLYAVFDDPNDSVQAVFGDSPSPMIVTSEGDGLFYNDGIFDSLTAPVNITPAYWSNQWDTYVTIDTTDAAGDLTSLTPNFASETNALQTSFVTTSAAWFVTPNALPQGLAGPEGRVLLAQFTVADVPGWGVSGSVSLQMIVGGNVIIETDQQFYCVSEVFSGACCLPDASCADDVTEADCIDMGGEYQGDFSLCDDAPCPGACCLLDGSCMIAVTEERCDAMLGAYQGDGTTCDPFPCSGACCLPDGSCMDDSWPDACATIGGTFQGLGTTCDIVDCPTACCLQDGTCMMLTQLECETVAGDFHPFLTCEDVQCVGACCVNGACFSAESELNCLAAGGTYLGDGISCGGNVCPPACPGDLDGSGDVGFADLVQLLAAWGPCV